MGTTIGNAGDFYRIRVVHVDEGDAPDLEWRDDILFRRPPSNEPAEYDVWRVEAVDVDDDDVHAVLASYGSSQEALEWSEAVSDDLSTMTKSEFERAYFPEQGRTGAG